MRTGHRWAAGLLALAVLAAAGGGCGGDATGPAPGPAERAAAFLEAHLDQADAPTQVLAARLGERHGVGGFERWGDTGRVRLAAPTPVDGRYAPAWSRLVDPAATVPPGTLDALPHTEPLERISWVPATALHCDTPAFPADWVATARRALDDDPEAGYVSTHLGLGLVALAELGCDPPGAAELRRDTVAALRSALAGTDRVDDLTLERVVVLAELDPATPVDPVWGERIAVAQRPDGGFGRNGPDDPAGSDWHTTLLAWWVLALLDGRGSDRPLFRP